MRIKVKSKEDHLTPGKFTTFKLVIKVDNAFDLCALHAWLNVSYAKHIIEPSISDEVYTLDNVAFQKVNEYCIKCELGNTQASIKRALGIDTVK